MQEYNRMQTVKRRFFAMRNGIIADTLRKAGLDYRMIFGLNLPQIVEIADTTPHDASFAEELWADRRTRESMLMAPMLYPADEMDASTASRWLAEAPTTEVADVLCLKLLRFIPGAADIAADGITSDSPMTRYASLRLMFNLLNTSASPDSSRLGLPEPRVLAATLHPLVESELKTDTPLTRPVAAQLLDEIEFILEE